MTRGALLVCAALAGCGNSPQSSGAPEPVAFLATGGAANFACLGTRVDPPARATAATVSLTVLDFETSMPVAGALVEVYFTLDDVRAGTPRATAPASDAAGHTTLAMPAGPYRVIFRTTADPAQTVETLEFNRAFDDPRRYSVSVGTQQEIPVVLAILPDDTKGVAAGSQRDCDEQEVGGVVLQASEGGAALPAANTFYFEDAAATKVPVRGLHWTSDDGVFAALNVPPGDVTLTASGRLAEGAPVIRLGVGVAPVRAAAVTIVQLEPLGPAS